MKEGNTCPNDEAELTITGPHVLTSGGHVSTSETLLLIIGRQALIIGALLLITPLSV